MNKILDVVEDIKQNITVNQYKIIMDSLMEVHKIEKKNIKSFTFKCFTLMNWLDSKLELDPEHYRQIKKTELEEFLSTELHTTLTGHTVNNSILFILARMRVRGSSRL
jgi:hypothetical protein